MLQATADISTLVLSSYMALAYFKILVQVTWGHIVYTHMQANKVTLLLPVCVSCVFLLPMSFVLLYHS